MTTKEKYHLKLFINFLKKENIEKKYINNANSEEAIKMRNRCFNGKNLELIKFLIYQIKEYPFNMFFNAFTWYATKEGHDFWETIHKKWYDFYYEQRIK